MVKINGKFLKYQVFGEKLAEKICLGWKPTKFWMYLEMVKFYLNILNFVPLLYHSQKSM